MTKKHFYVKFRDDDGQIYDIRVSEEYYFAFEKGQTGTLTLLDGKLDSFVLDEWYYWRIEKYAQKKDCLGVRQSWR